jgi:hypothetical protein
MSTKVANMLVNIGEKIALTDICTDTAVHADRLKSRMLASAALVIFGAGSALVKSGAAAAQYVANGVLGSIGAATNMAALAGTVTNAKFNVYVFFIDSAGTKTTVMGTEGATLAAVQWPVFPAGKACIGFTIINPTGTGNFVGGTTALDDATVVPNAVHVSVQGGFDPNTALNATAS